MAIGLCTTLPAGVVFDRTVSGRKQVFDLVAREPVTSTFWPATGAAGEYRVVLWLTATPRNAYGFSVQPLATSSRVSPTFSAKEVVIVF
jgi:hypothetical protein